MIIFFTRVDSIFWVDGLGLCTLYHVPLGRVKKGKGK
jgi:hypothetical protein